MPRADSRSFEHWFWSEWTTRKCNRLQSIGLLSYGVVVKARMGGAEPGKGIIRNERVNDKGWEGSNADCYENCMPHHAVLYSSV